MRKPDLDETIKRNLELLRTATGSDCAFLAPLTPDEMIFTQVRVRQGRFRPVPPGGARRGDA